MFAMHTGMSNLNDNYIKIENDVNLIVIEITTQSNSFSYVP
jgi:hypothetical protein